MIKFSKKDIKNEFEFGAYTRGIGYFNQGRVCTLKTRKETNEFIDLYGEVNGTLKYEQDITVYSDTWGVEFDGECSCPVGYNCKHVVAVLLEYLSFKGHTLTQHSTHSFSRPLQKQPAYATKTELEGWLKQFQIDKQKPQEDSLFDERKWFAYVLSPTPYPGKVSVKLFQSGYKVHSGYYKPKRQDFSQQLHNIRYGYCPAFINNIDKDILRRLDVSERRQFYLNDIYLDGQLGWQALIKMIKTRRCFWGSMDNEPLTMGNNIPVQLNWEQSQKRGIKIHKLSINSGNNVQLILTDPPCQVNIESNQLQKLDSDLTTDQLAQLLSTPTIAEKDIEQFNLDLIKNSIDRHIPLPINNTVEDLSDVKIIPKAIISTLNDLNTQLPAFHCLKLSLLYGNREIQLADEMTFVEKNGNTIFRLTRDRDNEMALLQPIIDLGFELKTVSIEDEVNSQTVIAVMSKDDSPIIEMNKWRQFLETDRYLLQQDGWQIEQNSSFYLDFIHPHDEWEVDIESENDWFSLKFDIQLGDSDETKLSLLPIISQLLSQYNADELPEEIPVEHHPGQILILPKEKIQPIIDLMIELFDRIPMGEEVIQLSKFDALLLNQLDSDPALELQWSGDLHLKELGNKLANFSGIKKVDPPKVFKGELRDYQHQGLSWLQFLREFEFSGILADDMGLGKTIQTLAHLQKEKSARRMKSPCLVIAPTSLMSNWKREAALFTPHLKVHISQGPDRHEHFDSLEKYDVILTTYPLIVRDYEILFAITYHYIVLDEAQNIKNPKSQATKCIKTLKAKHRLALTGTPMENHLGELWSIFDFLMVGFLGSQESFKTRYRNPIEKDQDLIVSKMLNKRIKPFLLRRSKQLVASELPPKTEIIKTVAFESSQSLLYETIRLSMEKKIQQAIATKGLNRSHITILDALLKLRQVCCDPQLVKLEQAKKVKHSAKMNLLMTMLPELVEEGRRVLIFSQFTSMLSIIEQALTAENITYSKLTGSTRKRDKAIETFTSGKVNVFLISLKAGGVGLNLIEADTVIHYDPWWNPAVENQASDRAHRIGQDKPVFIYKLVVENTLEEKILEMQARKQALADGVYGDKSSEDTTKLTAKDLQELLGIE